MTSVRLPPFPPPVCHRSHSLSTVWEGSPEMEVLHHIYHVEILLNLIRSFLLLVILDTTNHWKVVEHVGVGEIVDIEGEQEGTKLRQFH